jgi:CubicO group peptidase (beta-lactamase class C family)
LDNKKIQPGGIHLKKRLSLVSFLFAAIFLLTLPFFAATKPDLKAQLKGFPEFVNKTMAEWKVPGLVIAIVKDGKVILSEGFGQKDVKNKLKVSPQTLFAIGSSSKAFTATALGILADQGKLEWDKPVREYLPTFKLWDKFATEQMTPKDLVTHRSGLPRHDLMWYGSPCSRKELFDRLRYLEPSKSFRETFQYQNLMFMTAGILVGELSGTTWEDFVKKYIFDPLGMKSSNFSVEDSKKAPDFALPYREKDGKVDEMLLRNIDAIGPAGSINSNVSDMANWVMLQLNKGKFGDKQVISEANLTQLHTPQMVILEGPFRLTEKYDEMFFSSYGMGWIITSYRGHTWIHHGGNIDGFSALVTFMPRDNMGLVILTNLNGTLLPEVIALNVYDRLLGLNQVPWSARFKEIVDKLKAEAEKAKKEADKDRQPNTKPSHPLDDYAGDYSHPAYGVFSIQKDGENLKGKYNSSDFSLTHYHYDIFDMKNELLDTPMKATFTMDVKGNIASLAVQLEPSLKEIVFSRMPEKKMSERSFLEKFLGQYEFQQVVLTVQLKGENTLVITAPGQPETELIPYKGTEFNLKNVPGASIEFILDASGVVQEAKIKQSGAIFTAKKK